MDAKFHRKEAHVQLKQLTGDASSEIKLGVVKLAARHTRSDC
jgi:hypothetical protein